MKKRKTPKEPEFNILEYFRGHVENAPRDYQIIWLRFEYVRRNTEYQEDWLATMRSSAQSVKKWMQGDLDIIEGDTVQSDMDKARRELISKWSIPYPFVPLRPFPRTLIPKDRKTLVTQTGLRVEIRNNDDELVGCWEWKGSPKHPPLPSDRFGLLYSLKNDPRPGRTSSDVIIYDFGAHAPSEELIFVNYLLDNFLPDALVYDDGKRVDLTPFHDREVYCWNISDFTRKDSILTYKNGKVIGVDVFHDGGRLLAASGDRTEFIAIGETHEDSRATLPAALLQPGYIPDKNELSGAKRIDGDNPIDSFEIWRGKEREGEVEWDTDTWTLVAVNQKAGREEVIKELERLGILPRKGRGRDIRKCADELRAWDLNEAGFTHRQIASRLLNDPDQERKISKWISTANRYIRSDYHMIR